MSKETQRPGENALLTPTELVQKLEKIIDQSGDWEIIAQVFAKEAIKTPYSIRGSVLLNIADALNYNKQNDMKDKLAPLGLAQKIISDDNFNQGEERTLFKSFLEHDWQMTPAFSREEFADFLGELEDTEQN